MALQGQKLPWLFVLFLLSILRPVSSQYLLIPNSAKSYGPDGPWNAFLIRIGSNNQPVNVYFGGTFASVIISSRICDPTKSSCPARDVGGGVYNTSSSTTANTNSIAITGSGVNSLGLGGGDLLGITGSTAVMMDRMVLGDGLLQQTVQNVSINRVDSASQALPGGASYDLQVGFLSTGAPNLIQVFGFGDDRPPINATIPVNQLATNGATGSRAWGMHIGSAQLGQSGSLILGGYDRSRVASDPATFDIANGGDMQVILQTIKFGVMEGDSPWGSTPTSNMLVSDNSTSSSNPQLTLKLSTVPPYLYLPENTCNEMAKYLPVTFAANFGLYLWNTSDPKYSLIVNSTAYIEFGFSYRSGSYPIKIPMKLLALQLEAPFPVTTTAPYFPCRPTIGDNADYHLGRAFLQGAFVGLSWKPNKWWLAQAPGPAMQTSDIYDINPDDTTITAMSDVDWAGSWKTVLTVTNSTAGTTTGPGSSPTTSGTSSSQNGEPPSTQGLSGGAKAGIAIGVIGGLAILAGVVFLFMRRRRQGDGASELEAPPTEMQAVKQPLQSDYVEADNYAYNPQPIAPVEMDSGHRN